MSFFGGVKRAARITRLKTELMLHDREVGQRQDAFGVQLYDYLEPLSKNQDFYSADDRLTQVLRPPMLEAQRETAVVYNKIRQLKEKMKQQEIKRAAAFPNKAQNWQEKLSNAAKSTALAGQETKLKAEMVMLERELKSYKQKFGRALYGTLEELEDKEGWLPTDREVRSIYDDCRKDIEAAKKNAKGKLDELETLGVSAKELQQERDDAARAEQQQNNQGLWGGSGSNNQNTSGGYNAPPPSSTPTAPPASDPYASTPTSQLPVATSVGFTSSSHETPAMAFGTVAPPPAAPAPVISDSSFGNSSGYAAPAMGNSDPFAAPSGVSNGGMGSFGGGPMGGNGPPPPQTYNSSSNVMGSAMGMGGSFGDDSGGFAMGGSSGMGTGSNTNNSVMGGSADPWANNDPFAISSPTVPPPNPPSQAGAHKDANLFLY